MPHAGVLKKKQALAQFGNLTLCNLPAVADVGQLGPRTVHAAVLAHLGGVADFELHILDALVESSAASFSEAAHIGPRLNRISCLSCLYCLYFLYFL